MSKSGSDYLVEMLREVSVNPIYLTFSYSLNRLNDAV
ncbi:MAG: hypothetical protein ACJAWH_000922 [Maribacter sp.]|jgi:hypothetical protein